MYRYGVKVRYVVFSRSWNRVSGFELGRTYVFQVPSEKIHIRFAGSLTGAVGLWALERGVAIRMVEGRTGARHLGVRRYSLNWVVD